MQVQSLAGNQIRRRITQLAGQLAIHAILIAGVLFVVIPTYYMATSSFKSEGEIFALPIHWIPQDFQGINNYVRAFRVAPFARFFLNSAIVAVTRVVGVLFFCSLAGYGLAKYDFPGNRIVFIGALSTMMIPFQVVLLPRYVLIYRLGWINSFQGLIIPGLVSAFGIFLMRQFCLTIPHELLDAARIDGAGEGRTFQAIVFPLLKPPLATLAILTFMGSWNSLFWPMIVATRPEVMTLTVGMTFFQQPLREPYWTLIMAICTIATLPVVVVFLTLQKYFIQGVVMSGLK